MSRQEDNTVGSLTEVQTSILIGSLLGDGTMRKKDNALLEVNHCLEQKPLVDWIYSHFEDLSSTGPKVRRGNEGRMAYRFVTRSSPLLTGWYDQFFSNGKKIIPSDLKIDPLALAVWFMDDGCKSRSAVYLNTQQFTELEQLTLVSVLRECFGIESTLNRDKKYFRIRVRTSSIPSFAKLVSPYLLTSFQYKLPSVITP